MFQSKVGVARGGIWLTSANGEERVLAGEKV